jgi:hypothetical protein
MNRVLIASLTASALFALHTQSAQAITTQIRVTVENLAPANSISLAPVHFGFGQGTFDAFNQGSTPFLFGQPTIATAPITTIAEGGSGSTWQPAFAATEPSANRGTVLGPVINPFLPGQTSSLDVTVDTNNPFFTFGTMVVPSNDHFLGNDDPMEYRLFDAAGNLILNSITQDASEIWDNGSETENPANAAFLVGGVNANRVDENGVVQFNFSDLVAFNGLTTAAGYTFNSTLLSGSTDVIRISFSVIPEPATMGLVLAGAGLLAMRRRVAR